MQKNKICLLTASALVFGHRQFSLLKFSLNLLWLSLFFIFFSLLLLLLYKQFNDFTELIYTFNLFAKIKLSVHLPPSIIITENRNENEYKKENYRLCLHNNFAENKLNVPKITITKHIKLINKNIYQQKSPNKFYEKEKIIFAFSSFHLFINFVSFFFCTVYCRMGYGYTFSFDGQHFKF